ncbi:allatostatin-A-like [Oppia nitens]|uniref:allatostatin-A-like n=1 Tax=Oppia nitens TaxID=1686743 RepID=UPI0023DA184A|nr:allatostatin-A-like [Oppia nitens]
MSFRFTVNGNHFSVLNIMKCSLNCVIVSYLLCNLLFLAVMAMPEISPGAVGLSHKLNADSKGSIMSLEKRAKPRQYNFGIGKKSDFNDEIGLLDDHLDDSEETYGSDVDKRGAEQNRFAFGLGKRAKSDQRFQFGLGKRANQKDNRYAFGLGKRQDFDEYIKRRYSFGLGKRNPLQHSLQNYYISDTR